MPEEYPIPTAPVNQFPSDPDKAIHGHSGRRPNPRVLVRGDVVWQPSMEQPEEAFNLSSSYETIPDEAPPELEAKCWAPSWRRMCKVLLRNDYWGQGIGFSQHKSHAYKQYLDLMRRRRAKWNVTDEQLALTELVPA
jgi:hypothetical protein